jgi:hypothetical protein
MKRGKSAINLPYSLDDVILETCSSICSCNLVVVVSESTASRAAMSESEKEGDGDSGVVGESKFSCRGDSAGASWKRLVSASVPSLLA